MDAFLLARLARELEEDWGGAWLQQAWQDVEGRLVLQLRRSGPEAATRFLLLSALPEAQGLGTLSSRPACPSRPPAAASYLRAHVCGGRIDYVRCPPEERVVELGSRGREGLYRVMLEAVGRRGNWVVLDPGGLVRAAWRWEPADTHPRRPLEPGREYAPPPLRPAPPSLPPANPLDGVGRVTLDAAGLALESALEEARSGREAAAEEARVGALRKKLERRMTKIRGDLSRLPDPAALRAQADSLAASLGSVRKRDTEARVPDLVSADRVLVIPLEAGLSPGQNLNRLYEQARRSERARRALERRIEETEAELAAAGGGRTSEAAGLQGVEEPGLPYRRLKASNGWALWVGRNGKENDRLVREARPWDLWFHARDVPGAHVLLRLPGRDAKPSEAVILEAAALAAANCRAAGEGAVDVMVVEAGRLRKPKGASPGRVIVSGERTVRVRATP